MEAIASTEQVGLVRWRRIISGTFGLVVAFALMLAMVGADSAIATDFSFAFGSEGSGNGQFSVPYGIAVDASDDVWVTDYFNHRVQKWISNRPTVTTEAATEVTTKAATMHGAVNPSGLATSYHFEIGTSSSYGFSIPVTDKEVGAGSEAVEVNDEVAGLKTKTTYHFRVVATNAAGTSYGEDETFTTE